MLTEQQINDIAFYCYQRGVECYDVQLELVDHIADMIEDLQENNLALSFSDALQIAGTQFKDDEFKTIVKSKKQMLKTKISKLIEKEFVAFYTPPKVALTFLVYFIAIYLPYLIKCFGFIPMTAYFIVYGIVCVFYINPIDKEVKAIKDAMVQPLLSMKVKSKYEIIAKIIQVCFSILYFINLFTKKDSANSNLPHLVSEKILIFQFMITALTTYMILILSIITVRRNLYVKLWAQYTKTFAS